MVQGRVIKHSTNAVLYSYTWLYATLCTMIHIQLPLKAVILGVIGVCALAVLGYLLYAGTINIPPDDGPKASQFNEAAFAGDLQALKSVEENFASIRAFFVDLAKEKGGAYSFEILKRAILPPNMDLHLLGHAVGDELYKQENLEGMQYCTHDFRNACSHSIVVGALLADGLAVFDKVNEVCKKAPGGPGAYTMCFHGFGHGVLAYTEYEVPDAVELCKKVGTAQFFNEEAHQCMGGIVMEMHQGIHDPEIWAQKRDKYLTPGDPLRLCREYVPDEAKVLCYSYITPYIFDAAGAVNGNPVPEIYPKSFTFCDAVENDTHREACYAGLGKEFIVLAQDRDIRRMEDTPDDKLQLASSWCMLAHKEEAKVACLIEILDSLYWGGENDPEVSIRYCSLLEDGVEQKCFDHLFEITTYYRPDPGERKAICEAVPEVYAQQCTNILLE